MYAHIFIDFYGTYQSISSVQPTNMLPSVPLVYLNLFIFKNPAGSNPTSPAIDPSSLAGCSKKGTDWDLAFKVVAVTALVLVVNAEAPIFIDDDQSSKVK
jgi:hypothetical protein